MNRLRKDSGLNIHVICTGDKDQAKIAEKFDIEFIPMPNKPVSRKFQRSLTRASTYNPNSVLILGSDDIISTQTVINLHDIISGKPPVYAGSYVGGLSMIYFYSTVPETAGQLLCLERGGVFGAGKIVSNHILAKLDYMLWNKDKNYALDAMAQKRIDTITPISSVANGILVDVKTKINMNKFSLWKNKLNNVDPNIFYDILSKEEKVQLDVIIKNEVI